VVKRHGAFDTFLTIALLLCALWLAVVENHYPEATFIMSLLILGRVDG
jgi:hypothetical protein